MWDAVVIGGGFFGIETALELRRLGLRRVMVVEREAGLMRRASFVNQARVHNGYHYPRSLATAERSRANFEAFVAEYADAVLLRMEMAYAVAAGSKVSPEQFETFCRVIGVPCHAAPRRVARLFDPALVQQAYMTRELAFDSSAIARRSGHALREAGVEVRLGTQARIRGASSGHVELQLGPDVLRARHVVNCSYADIEDAGVGLRTRIRRELAEMVLIVPPVALEGLGVTVMDGPFFSTMPFPSAGLHSLSHVRYTPHAATEASGTMPQPSRSNRAAMLRDSQRMLPCLAEARVVGSIFETKVTLLRNEADDGRPVLMERSATMPRVLSVLGAKIDNIYEVRSYLRSQDWSMAA
jgi:glycine/D-amino acid oxidase-like deaminating enzyme